MAGRPNKITQDILAKLEDAFMKGHSDEEACLIAEIDPSTLYRYCEKYPNFASKKEVLKKNVTLLARRNIYEKIKEGDVELSKWYLERRAKDEFSPKQIIDNADLVELERNRRLDQISESMRAILNPKPTLIRSSN